MTRHHPALDRPCDRAHRREKALIPCAEKGSTTSEQVLLLSVVLVALLGVAPLFVQMLEDGILGLSQDVVEMLTGRRSPPDSPAGGGPDDAPPYADGPPHGDLPQHPHHSGGGDSQDTGDDDSSSGDPDDGNPADDAPSNEDEAPPPAEEEESTCPYVYDEASERWRDPETGQYVSGAAASQAGC